MTRLTNICAIIAVLSIPINSVGVASAAEEKQADALIIAEGGRSEATIVTSSKAGPLETRAAQDLAMYIEKMSGAKVPIVSTSPETDEAVGSSRPIIILGEKALSLRPELRQRLAGITKPRPFIRADGIVLQREGTKVFLAGNSDRGHYFAVAQLLREWGVRWFMPGPFGECVPETRSLAITNLNESQSSPFEIRTFWISWLGDTTGVKEFQLRNMMTDQSEVPPAGHVLGQYVRTLGRGAFDISQLGPEAAMQIADATDKMFSNNRNFSLGMDDGVYTVKSDPGGSSLPWDPAFNTWSITDPMLSLYEKAFAILRQRHPRSTSKVGFLAYSNMTLPPEKSHNLDPALFGQLAPIDVDPIHGVGDPKSPAKTEYGDWVKKWTAALGGRLSIYDYDQSMLLWRDLPNPSHRAFEADVKLYEKAGVLGVSTESRSALATIFTNLYLRARLLWDPHSDVPSLLDDFYKSFYGPAAGPMSRYWGRIFDAWSQTDVTEHEYFIAPAVYTAALIEILRGDLADADAAVLTLRGPGRVLSRNESMYLDRLRFTRIGFKILDNYISMVNAAATDADYGKAVIAGERGLGARAELEAMGKNLTSLRLENGPAFWPGEVRQYEDLLDLTSGTTGQLVARLPLEWSVRADVAGGGLSSVMSSGSQLDKSDTHMAYKSSTEHAWEFARTDIYIQAQVGLTKDLRKTVGSLLYEASLDLSDNDVKKSLRVHFPGLFGSCILYLNESLIGDRAQDAVRWRNDYRFEWDLPIKGARPGANTFALKCSTDGRMAGIFRRPFIYAPLIQ